MDNFQQNELQWQDYVKHTELNDINFSTDFYRSDLTSFQKLLLFNCFQPAKLLVALYPYICEVLGTEFTESPPFDLASAFADSTCCKPLLFILSANYDPITCIRQLAETQLIERNRLTTLSMGQHQNSLAIKLIEDGIKSGDWVILQNCHLAADWMYVLERICDNLAPDTTNPDFRLFLTTNSTDIFPLSIVQGSVKLVNEPPISPRDTLWRTFTTQPISNENWLNENKNTVQLKALLFSLSFLHFAILERRNFGGIGWNHPYDFNDTDLYLSIYQFYEYLNSFNDIPFEHLQILLAECNYGGHINDLCDLKLLKLFTEYFCSKEFCDNDGKLANNTLQIETFFPHNYSNIDSILTHIKSLDDKSDASVCGLHRNANALREQCETNFLIRNVTLAQVRSIGSFFLFSFSVFIFIHRTKWQFFFTFNFLSMLLWIHVYISFPSNSPTAKYRSIGTGKYILYFFCVCVCVEAIQIQFHFNSKKNQFYFFLSFAFRLIRLGHWKLNIYTIR